MKRPILLVHGAHHGGWCWRIVRRTLQSQGHEVFTPTLTGMGERAHLESTALTLQTHVDDVVNTILCEELTHLVLVGHSYSGLILATICDRLRDRIAHVLYLDTPVPLPERGDYRATATARWEVARATARAGFFAPAAEPAAFGVDPERYPQEAAWLARRLTDWPVIGASAEPAARGSAGIPRTFVTCTAPDLMFAEDVADLAALRADPTWTIVSHPAAHDVMVTEPGWTARLIANAART